MATVKYIIKVAGTNHFIGLDSKIVGHKYALEFYSTDAAIQYIIKNCKCNVSIVKQIVILESTESDFKLIDIILKRNSHLDANYIGQKGNPFLYYYDKEPNIFYSYEWSKLSWVLCEDWDSRNLDKLFKISIGDIQDD